MKPSKLLAAVVLPLLFLLASCSTSPPKIAETFWQLNLVRNPETGKTHESLSLFLHVTDENGLSDLESIYLLNDSDELYWRLDSSNWQHSERNGELWVGSNSIEMPNLSPLPRGKYRVLLSNLAGERVTDSIYVSADRLNPAKAAFPTLSIAGGRVELGGGPQDSTLWIYNGVGQLVGQRSLTGSYPVSSLLPSNERGRTTAPTLYAYTYDKSCGCGLITGPYQSAR